MDNIRCVFRYLVRCLVLLELAMANKKDLEKPRNLGAIGFSILIFILGAIALEKANEERISRRRKLHNK